MLVTGSLVSDQATQGATERGHQPLGRGTSHLLRISPCTRLSLLRPLAETRLRAHSLSVAAAAVFPTGVAACPKQPLLARGVNGEIS